MGWPWVEAADSGSGQLGEWVGVGDGWTPQCPRGSARGHCPGRQGVKERAYASSGEAITSLPVSIPLSTVQPSKLPVSIPLASVVLPSRAEKAVSAALGPSLLPQASCARTGRATGLSFLLEAQSLSVQLLAVIPSACCNTREKESTNSQ